MLRSPRYKTIPHAQFEAELPELALGVLCGKERLSLLEHVASCATCAADLRGLVATVDGLRLLAAEADPPVGFERRVISGLAMAGWPGPRGYVPGPRQGR